MLLLSLIYNSSQNFGILNVICSHVWIITAPAVYIQMPFMFTSYFYSLGNPVFFSSSILIPHRESGFKYICHDHMFQIDWYIKNETMSVLFSNFK
jgi:hypothetical protein